MGVAEEVRVVMARKRMRAVELAAAIKRSQAYVSRRLNGETAFDIDDLENIGTALGVDPADLIPREGGLLASSPDRQPIDPLAARIVAVGGEARHTGPVRAQRIKRPRLGPMRPLTPALV